LNRLIGKFKSNNINGLAISFIFEIHIEK